MQLSIMNRNAGKRRSWRMRSNHSANGKLVVYIKSTKDMARAEVLLGLALTGRSTIIDTFVETTVRKNKKPELEKAIKKCNERAAKLIIPNIGHLPRSLAFCNGVMKLEGNDAYIYAIAEEGYKVDVWKYWAEQLFNVCVSQIELNNKAAKKGLDKKRATGWKAGNPVNLDVATINASKARERLADDYCRAIIPQIREIQRFGKVTLQGIADALKARNIKTRRGKTEWTPMGVSNILNKAKKLEL